MTHANGHTPDLATLREQTRLARAQAKLHQAQAEAALWESAGLSTSTLGLGWSDLLDPYAWCRDDFGSYWMPLGTGFLHSRQDGRLRPFLWTDFDLDQMRSLARHLATRNDQAIGILECLADYTVRTGYDYEARPGRRMLEDATAKELARQVQEVIEDFQSLNTLGELTEEQFTWADRERESVTRSVRDGEVALRAFDQGDGMTLVRFLEPEQIRQGGPVAGDPNCAFGVESAPGDVERILGYWVTYDGSEYERVDAADVAHLKLNVDSCVKRGLSDFYSTGEALDGVRKLLRNMNVAGGVQAAIAWIEQYDGATQSQIQGHVAGIRDLNRPQVQHPLSGRELNYQRFEPGTIAKVGKGKTYIPAPLAGNTSAHTSIVQACLRAIGARWKMPEYFTGDSSNANYASTLVSGAPFVTRVECRQAIYGRFFLRILWMAIRNAARAGRFVVSGRTFDWHEISRYVDVVPTPPQVAIANDAEQASIDHQDIAAGVMSLQTRRARRGLDDTTERRNLEEEPLTRAQGQMTDLDPAGNPVGGEGGQEVGDTNPLAAFGLGESRREGERWQGESGRWFTLKDGHTVPIAAPAGADAGSDAGSDSGGTDAPAPAPEEARARAAVYERALALAGGAAEAGKAVAAKVGDAAWQRLSEKQQKGLAKAWAVGRWLLHTAETGIRLGKRMVREAAKERGLSDEQVEKRAKVIGIVDNVMAWTVNVPAVTLATGNPLAGKAAGLMPLASMGYLAWSTARNPLATLRAAKTVLTTRDSAHHEEIDTDMLEALALRLAGLDDDTAGWYTALLLVALDEEGDPRSAMARADAALADAPAPGDDESDAEDALAALDDSLDEQALLDWANAITEAKAAKHKPGDVWKSSNPESNRWFTMRQDGRVVPTKAPQGQDKGKPAAGKTKPPAQKATPADVIAHAKDLLSQGKIGAKHVQSLSGMLLQLTVPQMNEVKKALGLKASGPKAELAAKLAERALAAAPAAPAGKEKPADKEKPAGKSRGKKEPSPAPKPEPEPKPEKKPPREKKPPAPAGGDRQHAEAVRRAVQGMPAKGQKTSEFLAKIPGGSLGEKQDVLRQLIASGAVEAVPYRDILTTLKDPEHPVWVPGAGVIADLRPGKNAGKASVQPAAPLSSADHERLTVAVAADLLAAQARSSFLRPTLQQMYDQARTRHPDLTMGQFHDILRSGSQKGLWRLDPYTQAQRTVPAKQSDAILYLDRDIKAYIDQTPKTAEAAKAHKEQGQ